MFSDLGEVGVVLKQKIPSGRGGREDLKIYGMRLSGIRLMLEN